MGTTLVAARLDGNEVTVVNVGDSRAYIVRGSMARQMTRDHSYVAEQMRMGLMTEGEAERSPLQSAITRAIGIDDDVQPDFYNGDGAGRRSAPVVLGWADATHEG